MDKEESKYNIIIMYNGMLYFAGIKEISDQYLGCGSTEDEAISEMWKTINEYNLEAKKDV